MDPNETLNSGNQDGKGNAKLFSNEFKDAQSSVESDNESTGESSSSGSQDEDNGNVPAISVVTIRCTNCGNNMHQKQKNCEKCGSTSEAINVSGMIKKSESEFVSHETKFCTDFKGANIGRENKSKSKSASIAPKIIADCETANIGNVSVSKMSLDEIDCKNCEHTVNQDQIFCDRCGYKLKTECVGTRDGKPCFNLISRTSKFCTDCGAENLENKSGN